MRTVILALALALMSACSAQKPLPTDPAALKAEVGRLVPDGASVDVAKAALTKRGLEVRVETINTPARKTYLFGKARLASSAPVTRDWLVRFEVRDGRVFDLFAQTDFTGP